MEDDSNLQPNAPGKEFNILILGETGAGKSTTLNAFANYLRYGSFEQALQSLSGFTEVIPSCFTMNDPETNDEFEVKIGSHSNENPKNDGSSKTISPVEYEFGFGNNILRIIDTPGIGDTNNEDELNFEKILALLQFRSHLHAIIMLMNNTQARKTNFFKYCISELLSRLDKGIANNIVFCFTHSRASRFGPGNGFKALKGFLENDLKEVSIELKPNHNCFFIDNEAYLILVAKKVDYPITDEDAINEYKISWDKSIKQIDNMLKHIVRLPAHQLDMMLSLNNVGKFINEMAGPLIRTQQNIQQNIDKLSQKLMELEQIKRTNQPTSEELKKLLQNVVYDLEMRPLKYASTVCTDIKCIEILEVEGEKKINYKTRCHENCKCIWVTNDYPGSFMLCYCEVMAKGSYVKGLKWYKGIFSKDGWKSYCLKCKCPTKRHMHITCEYVKVPRIITDSKSIPDHINQTKRLIDDYSDELVQIENICQKFQYLMANNSYVPLNKQFEKHLDLMIDEARKKNEPIEKLIKQKQKRQENEELFKNGIKPENQNVALQDFPILLSQLFNLPHNGNQLKAMWENCEKVKANKSFPFRSVQVFYSFTKDLTKPFKSFNYFY